MFASRVGLGCRAAAQPASGPTTVVFKLWAPGGGSSLGGGGAWVTGTRVVDAGTSLTLKIGQTGSTTTGVNPYPMGGASLYSGYSSGGGLTGLFLTTGLVPIAIAGAGAGGNPYVAGGAGGNLTSAGNGTTTGANATAGTGATSSAGGNGGDAASISGGGAVQGVDGASQEGGDGASGGGDGYYGGGGGSLSLGNGTGTGGGGTSYVDAFVTDATVTAGSGSTTGNSSDEDFPGSVGDGGENGYAVIIINGVKTTYSYTGSDATIAA